MLENNKIVFYLHVGPREPVAPAGNVLPMRARHSDQALDAKVAADRAPGVCPALARAQGRDVGPDGALCAARLAHIVVSRHQTLSLNKLPAPLWILVRAHALGVAVDARRRVQDLVALAPADHDLSGGAVGGGLVPGKKKIHCTLKKPRQGNQRE